MPFLDENIAANLPKDALFQTGRSNVDNAEVIERGIAIPWSSDPAGSYVYYDCAVGVMLDSGIVVHNRLPQVNLGFDTLASADINDPNLDKLAGFGVNLRCIDQYQDIVQRMGHARYWFRLWGQAMRIGYQIPIPGIKVIGGVQAIPYDRNPQWAYNRIMPGGNYSGVVLWHAQWSLWYTTTTATINNNIPVVDLAGHVKGTNAIPTDIQSPYSQPDDNAETQEPPGIGRQ